MRNIVVLSLLSLALVSVACGGKGTAASPTSPSPTVNAGVPTNSTSGAKIGGTVAASTATGAAFGPAALAALSVQVVGTSISSAVTPTGSFSLANVPPGDVSIRVSGSGDDAVVTVAGVQAGDSIQVSLVVTGNSGRVDADSRGGASGKQELEGLIESKTPPDMLVVNGQIVKVVAGATDIRKGGTPMTYADLMVGFRVHVRGTTSAAGVTPSVLTADLIIVQDTGGNATEVKGTVGAILSGSCSSLPLKFTVGTTTVTATSTTMFTPGCSAVVAGAMVSVDGTTQADGSLLATRVDVEVTEISIHGTVLAIAGGTCGAGNLAFSVTVSNPAGTKQVVTNASTHFVHSCAEVAAGAVVNVSGTLQADHSILAINVVVLPSPGGGGGGG